MLYRRSELSSCASRDLDCFRLVIAPSAHAVYQRGQILPDKRSTGPVDVSSEVAGPAHLRVPFDLVQFFGVELPGRWIAWLVESHGSGCQLMFAVDSSGDGPPCAEECDVERRVIVEDAVLRMA